MSATVTAGELGEVGELVEVVEVVKAFGEVVHGHKSDVVRDNVFQSLCTTDHDTRHNTRVGDDGERGWEDWENVCGALLMLEPDAVRSLFAAPEDAERVLELVEKTKEMTLPNVADETDEKRLPNAFARGMKPKKKHEVLALAQAVEGMMERVAPERREEEEEEEGRSDVVLFDLGAGKGYVSQFLAHSFERTHVVCIDSQEAYLEGAKTRLERLEGKHPGFAHRVTHLTHTFSSASAPVLESVLDQVETVSEDPVRILIGLHTCGNLAKDVGTVFASHAPAFYHGLVLSPCCHNLRDSFPSSKSVRSVLAKAGVEMGYNARNLACLATRNRTDLARACHLFTYALLRVGDDGDDPPDLDVADPIDRVQTWIGAAGPERSLVLARYVFVYALKLLVAPVVEHLIVLDLVHFLREQGHSAWAEPVFDQHLSPRRFVIFAHPS